MFRVYARNKVPPPPPPPNINYTNNAGKTNKRKHIVVSLLIAVATILIVGCPEPTKDKGSTAPTIKQLLGSLATAVDMPETTDEEKVKKQNKIQAIYALIEKTDPKYKHKPETKDELATFIKAQIWAQGKSGTQNWKADLNNIDTSLVTDMSYLFSSDNDKGKGLYKYSGNLDDWDVSSVTNMVAMFKGAKDFKRKLQKWDKHLKDGNNYKYNVKTDDMFTDTELSNESPSWYKKLVLPQAHRAIIAKKYDELKTLIENATEREKVDGNGNTPLHFAILNDDKEATKHLISAGANVKAQNTDKKTPIILELESKQINNKILLMLIKAGADYTTKTKRTYTSHFRKKEDGKLWTFNIDYNAFWQAFQTTDIDLFLELTKRGLKVPEKLKDWLIKEAYHSCNGVDAFNKLRTNKGKFPILHTWVADKKTEHLEKRIILAYMAGADMNLKDTFLGNTLLHTAAFHFPGRVPLLIKLGLKPSAKNYGGVNALHLYKQKKGKDQEIIKLLTPKE